MRGSSLLRHAYSFLLYRPRAVVLALFLLMIVELGLAFANAVPIEHEWLLGWALFLTTLAWMGMAGLVGAVAPIEDVAMKYAHAILAVLLAAVLTMFIYLASSDGETVSDQRLGSMMLAWLGMTALVGAVAPVYHNTKAFSLLVIAPLSVIGWLCLPWGIEAALVGKGWDTGLAMAFLLACSVLLVLIGVLVWKSTIFMAIPWRITLLIGSLAASIGLPFALISGLLGNDPQTPGDLLGGAFILLVMLPMLAFAAVTLLTIVYMRTMRPVARKIATTAMGTWVMTIVVGWCWFLAMDDGLDAFIGKERTMAETALEEADYSDTELSALRVVKESDGEFRVLSYSWWGR